MARIKRFGVLSMAYFLGLYGIIIGLIFSVLMGIFQIILSSIFSNSLTSITGEQMTYGLSFGWLNLLLFPLIYGILMFISGLIFTPITNLILRITSGLELDITNK